jgi:lysophospholipase L1-like esterase
MRALENCAICGLLLVLQVTAAAPTAWVATWATSPQSGDAFPNKPLVEIQDQTVRERVRISVGGSQIRIRLSNEYGSAPLLVGSSTVATPTDAASVRPGSVHSVTFGGRTTVVIPTGAPVLSDPVPFAVAQGAEISISLYFPERAVTSTMHELALKRAVISRRGDHTHAEKIDDGVVSTSSVALSAVLVPARSSQRLVVTFGDSVTDGYGSSMDADHSWPSDLARRLEQTAGGSNVAVVNAGVAGNRLLNDCLIVSVGCSGASALARFDRDALALPGVTHVVLSEGINDIAFPGAKLGGVYFADPGDGPTAEDLIGAYHQLIARAHARGVTMIGATMTPFEGANVPDFYSESKEAVRQATNRWIRTSGAFDAVVDFDALLRDPDHPARLLPRFASPDRLHPNDAGYQAMADAIDLALFK